MLKESMCPSDFGIRLEITTKTEDLPTEGNTIFSLIILDYRMIYFCQHVWD
jgi:hypothetical protein